MDLDYYLDKFRHLKMNPHSEGKSPHKVCLLLAVMELVQNGTIRNNRIVLDNNLKDQFSRYFKLYSHVGDRNNPGTPFFHLKGEGFWHLAFFEGVDEEAVNNYNSYSISHAYLDSELFTLIESGEYFNNFKNALLQNFESQEADLISLCDLFSEISKSWPEAIKEQYSKHPLAELFRNKLESKITNLCHQFDSSYLVKASAGSGNWANVPWVSILDPKITMTTQNGVYPVYLFCSDGSGIYLSLNQGTTNPTKEYGPKIAKERALEIKEDLLKKIPGLKEWGLSEIDLHATTALGKSYEVPSIVAKFYSSESIPQDEVLEQDLQDLLSFYSQVSVADSQCRTDTVETIQSLPKSFLLLAGISGTGKTRFVRKQAELTGSLNDTYCLVCVRPDWHEPSDLLGYVSRLGGKPTYIVTDVLCFLVKAWQEIMQAGIELNDSCVSGASAILNQIRPFWLCLDEMNLAPVEQYFADYLSVLETRDWSVANDNFTYSCEPLLKASVFNNGVAKPQLRNDLGLSDSDNDNLWDHFCKHGISLPFNLIVAGTVNMDETTHGFSRKVIDRALSFDFGEFFPNDFCTFFEPDTEVVALSYPLWSDVRDREVLAATCDSKGERTVAFLEELNSVLCDTPFQLAYRALNELLLSVVAASPQDDPALLAVWDDFVMCKVLPRIEGDADKLTKIDAGGKSIELLDALTAILDVQFEMIKEGTIRPDLYRKDSSGTFIPVACRSLKKLQWMKARLNSAGFTSFWP